MRIDFRVGTFLGAIFALASVPLAGAGSSASTVPPTDVAVAPAAAYVVDFLSTAADGGGMKDKREVVGTSPLHNRCCCTCLPLAATVGFWYRLGDPASVRSMPPAPQGYRIGADPSAINDAGDQARFLIKPPQNLVYLFRFHHEGTWQQISTTPTGRLSPYGVGSITDADDIAATVAGAAVITFGFD